MTKLGRRKYNAKQEEFLLQLENCMLNGEWNQARLGARFNRDVPTISRGMKTIRERWYQQNNPHEELREKRLFRIRQLDNCFSESMNAWHKSKKPTVEKTVRSEPCSFCSAVGSFTDKDGNQIQCPICRGSCVKVEVTVKRKKSNGDAEYLNTALRAHREACMLESLYPERSQRTKVSMGIGPDGTLNIETTYENAPTEDLLDVMAAIEDLKEKSRYVENGHHNGQVIEVESVKKIPDRLVGDGV